MENKKSSNWIGPAIFIALIAAWTFFNYQNYSRTIKQSCLESQSSSTASFAQLDAACDCTRKKAVSEMSPFSFLPLIGRLAAPKENEAFNIGVRAAAICMSQEMDLDISAADLETMLKKED